MRRGTIEGSVDYKHTRKPPRRTRGPAGRPSLDGAERDYIPVPVEPLAPPPAAMAGMLPQTTDAPALAPWPWW